jgi:DNA replication and repair protein RecF
MLYLSRIQLLNFKNHESLDLELSSNVNAIVGKNGMGKTNILDAIYYLSMCKSYLNSMDRQNIKFDQAFFSIHGQWMLDGQESSVVCAVKSGAKKVVKKNKVSYEKLSDHIGLFPVVFISPYDGDLIADGSETRRKWMDGIISQIDKGYLEDLIAYQRVLEQRNALLKQLASGNGTTDNLEVWNHSLAQYGTRIHERRQTFIEEFTPIFDRNYREIGTENEGIEIQYKSDFQKGDFIALLGQNERRDLIFQYTTVGAHKDDLLFNLNGNPVKKYGSQGQQKSFILALRLAQYHYLHSHSGKKPVLLLDDIFDKLDHSRVQKIIDLVSNEVFGQVIITDTEKTRLEELLVNRVTDFRIFELPLTETP